MIIVTNAPSANRYEAHIDGVLAGILAYVEKRGRLALARSCVASKQRRILAAT